MELLNTTVWNELREALGPELDGLLHFYASTLPGQVDELRQALQKDDRAVLKRCAHSLKGSSSSVGAQALAEHAEQVERVASSADHVALESLVRQVSTVAERTLVAMERSGWLASGPQAKPPIA